MKTANELAEEVYGACPSPLSLAVSILTRDAEWRRLVEEAQGERDRLKGELAEARRLAVIGQAAVDWATDTGECHFCHMDGAAHDIEVCPIAATPAEQAKPTYEDGEGRPAPQLNTEHLISSTPIKAAEQAQGEGTKLPCGHAPHGASIVYCVDPTGLCTFSAFGPRRTLPKDANPEKPAPTGGLLADVNAQVAELAKRVETIEEWARRQFAEPWFDPERGPAPPPPEAAGPVECEFCDASATCVGAYEGTKEETAACDRCCSHGNEDGYCRPIHTVPPIPEGGAR